MTDFTEYTDQASSGVKAALRQAHDINVAAIDVLRNLTYVMVPISVATLPNADKLVPPSTAPWPAASTPSSRRSRRSTTSRSRHSAS